METTAPAVFQLGFILALAALAGWAARRVSLPAVIGYLAVGILVSEFTPGYVADRHQLEVLADVGVVLLLFEVGIEIDPLNLHRDRGHLLLLAPTQLLAVRSSRGRCCIRWACRSPARRCSGSRSPCRRAWWS